MPRAATCHTDNIIQDYIIYKMYDELIINQTIHERAYVPRCHLHTDKGDHDASLASVVHWSLHSRSNTGVYSATEMATEVTVCCIYKQTTQRIVSFSTGASLRRDVHHESPTK